MNKDIDFRLFGKLNREFKTITMMINIYCTKHHHSRASFTPRCQECEQFRSYVKQRLDRCPYGENKPSCKQCPIHCYKPEQKIKSQSIMRYSGPKMLFKHPIMAINHLIHDKQPIPTLNTTMTTNRNKRKSFKNKE